MIVALDFGSPETLPDGRAVRPARFVPRSSLPASAACLIANGAREQLSRAPRPLPKLKLAPAAPSRRGALFDLKAEDIAFEGYDPWPAIKAPVAV